MRLLRFALFAGLALSVVCAGAMAQGPAGGAAWPAKPIKWIVPYTPGGITDNATRMVLQKVQEQTGWTIVVENKPGANSMLGADLAAKSPPDGSTFLTVIAAHASNATLYAGRMPYDPVKSFAPVSLVGVAPLIMTATNNLPAKDVKELIAYAKANPGKVSFGSSGVGAAAHLTTELLKQTAGIDMVHVPYKGTAPALQDLIGGNLQILVDTPSSLMPHVKAGKIKSLGMFSAKRLPGVPEVPTLAEAGLPDFEITSWNGLFAPAKTDPAIVQKLNAAIVEISRMPDIQKTFADQAAVSVATTPEQFRAHIEREIKVWGDVIRSVGVQQI